MSINFIEGINDRTDQGLRKILMSQARLRAIFAAIVILSELFLFATPANGLPMWYVGLSIGYCLYVITPILVLQRGTFSTLLGLLVATAVTDPLMMTIWIVLTGKFSSLIAGFYLFTILGFGFRTGRPLMHLCQTAAMAGFIAVFFSDPYWTQNPVVWAALAIPLIVVPFYASTLIKTLREAREHAEQESRAKSELLAKVSHELRTPLTGIVATAELLTIESSDRNVRYRADTILTLSDNLLQEINDLLDAAKYDAEAIEFNAAPLDLYKKIGVLRTTFEAMATKKGVAFRAEIDPAITDFVVADAHHLNRVLLNLTGNAVKFTDKGIVKLAVDVLDQTPEEYSLRFSVSDTGIGIPEAFHAKVFQPFAQVDQGTNRRYGGTGLGLTLSQKTVALMGGDLRFESVPGKGSRFWFDLRLPRHAGEPQSIPAPASDVIAPKRILVAEDNVTNLILIQEMLHIDHHEVVACTSGIEALSALVKQDFDLLLLDYNLGDMDGVRILQTYQFGRLHPAPAIFLTADATVQTANRLKSAGGAGTLYKPVTLAALRKALAQIEFPETETGAMPEIPLTVDTAKPDRPSLKIVQSNPLDPEIIEQLRSVNGRPGFLAKLLSHAEADISRSADQLCDALLAKNHTLVMNVAHALKGVSANVGAVRLATLSTAVMSLSTDELEASRDRLAADVRGSAQAALVALRKVAAEEEPGSTSTGARSLHLD